MMQRVLVLIAVTVISVASAQEWRLEEAAEPFRGTTLTVGTVAWTEAIQTVAADFTAATGIDVSVVQVPSDQILEKTILELRSGGTAYDLFTYTYTRPYTEADLLPDLSPFFADADLADPNWNSDDFVNFEKYALDPDEPEKIVGIPFGASGMVLYYLSDLFEAPEHQEAFASEYGYPLAAPDTLQELLDVAAYFDEADFSSFSGADGVGIALPGARDPALFWYFSFLAAGEAEAAGETIPGILDAEQQPLFGAYSEGVMTYLDELAQYAQEGYLQADDTAIRELFVSGGAAMVITWDSFISSLAEGDIAGRWALTGIPSHGLLGGWSLGINPNSENQEAAFLLAQYLSTPEADVRMFELEGRYPSRQSTYASESYLAFNPYAGKLAAAKEVAIPQVDNAATAQIIDAISEGVSLMLADQLSPAEAAARVNENVETALFDAGY